MTTAMYGSALVSPKGEGYNLRINGRWFRTIANDEVPLTIGSKDSLAPRQDAKGSIYGNVLDIGYAWSRTDLSGGEGLDWDPRELALEQDQAPLDGIRFFSSNNINIRRPETQGDQYSLRLSHAYASWVPDTPFTKLRDMAASEDRIYIADNRTISWFTSWSATVPSGSDTLPSQVRSIAVTPNNTVMATTANGNVYVKRSINAQFSLAYGDGGATKLEARGVWYVNGRFIVSSYDNVDVAKLFAIEWDGTDWDTQPHIDDASGPFISVVESGPAIVAAVMDGTIRSYTPNNDNTDDVSLIPRSRMSVPLGELPMVLGSNAGVLLIVTTADTEETATVGGDVEQLQIVRLYQAEVLSSQYDYIVGQLQLRRNWKATTHEPLETRNMAATRDEIFWFVREHIDGDFLEALWRFDLVTNGISRIGTAPPGVNLNAVTIFDSLVSAIDFRVGGSIIIEDFSRYADMGWIVFPNITFGLNTDIAWMATVLEAQNLVSSGIQVELWRTEDPQGILDWQDPSWVLTQRISTQLGTGLETQMKGVTSRTLALQLRIFNHSADTQTPEVTRVALRGIPAHRDSIMMVPINVSDYVSVPYRQPSRVAGLGDLVHQDILNLIGQSVAVEVIMPPMTFNGVVNNISEPVTFLADRGSVTKHCMVEFRGKWLSGDSSTIADAPIGIGLLGVTTVGLGQSQQT